MPIFDTFNRYMTVVCLAPHLTSTALMFFEDEISLLQGYQLLHQMEPFITEVLPLIHTFFC